MTELLGIGQLIATGAQALDKYILTDQEKLEAQSQQAQAAAVQAQAAAVTAQAQARVESSRQLGLYFVLGAGLITAGVIGYALIKD